MQTPPLVLFAGASVFAIALPNEVAAAIAEVEHLVDEVGENLDDLPHDGIVINPRLDGPRGLPGTALLRGDESWSCHRVLHVIGIGTIALRSVDTVLKQA